MRRLVHIITVADWFTYVMKSGRDAADTVTTYATLKHIHDEVSANQQLLKMQQSSTKFWLPVILEM